MSACENCGNRPGTQKWVGSGGALALSHGMYSMWCEVCVLDAQIEHAREVAGKLPLLEARKAGLLADDGKRGEDGGPDSVLIPPEGMFPAQAVDAPGQRDRGRL